MKAMKTKRSTQHCEDVEQIMKEIPSSFIKKGLGVIFCFMCSLVVGSYFYKYPEIIACPVILTTTNPPITLYTKTTQTIQRLFVDNNDFVHKGKIIAMLENTANYTDVLKLEKDLNTYGNTTWDSLVLSKQQPFLKLGELQDYYNSFAKNWNIFNEFLHLKYYLNKTDLLNQQITRQRLEYQAMLKQHDSQRKNYLLAKSQYLRDSSFFSKHHDVAVSLHQHEQTTQKFLKEEIAYMSFCSSLRSANNQILILEQESLDLHSQYERELITHRTTMDETYNSLREQLKQWKGKYIVESPIAGNVTFTRLWKENQLIKEGESVVTIVPEQTTKIFGYSFINTNAIGKVKKGQPVNIKLNGFPYMEYGVLKGSVINISLVPEENKGYIVEIELDSGMQSSYNKEVKFIQKMEGSAEFITNRRRLLTHIVAPLKSLLKN